MSDLKAVLGPTNTGKTHYAVERMLAHSSGMIGLPLRLLAREVYDRLRAAKGDAATALITGEERIWPAGARYFACTVEAMPTHVPVDCLAIDEIQLAEDPDRGHVFTDRLLHARGRHETLFLGAETMRPMLRSLDLPADNDPRNRFSELVYSGPLKVTKLPKRSAVIAFGADAVYALGELLRRQKGGAAIIMGALSPRTRNAQVDLYQSGEVDYLVATDAVGMGLNLDVDHVAFAAMTKFDGRRHRPLRPAEMGQIAGRAGRFRNNGSFGETGDCPPFDNELVSRIVNHTFDPVDVLQWRNSDLDFTSLEALIRSLSRPSGSALLRQNPNALDEWVLRRLAVDPELADGSHGKIRVRRLWTLCSLPDFRKAGHEGHYRLVQSLLDPLADPDARLSDDAMQNRLERLSSTQGDIAALQGRLAAIRTWTYAAHRDDWLANPEEWRDNTRRLEDELSDALHAALTERFVDRRTSALLAGLKRDQRLMVETKDDGEIWVEGHLVGRLAGLTFTPATMDRSPEGKAVRHAALKALEPILAKRLQDIAGAEDDAFSLSSAGTSIMFGGAPVAMPVKGSHWLKPTVALVGGDSAAPELREAARSRMDTWLDGHLDKQLPSLRGLGTETRLAGLSGAAKGLAFRLYETGAAIDLRNDPSELRFDAEDREALKAIGVRTGRVAAHVPDAQKPAAQALISALRSLHDGAPCPAAPEGAGSFAADADWTDTALAANGYLKLGSRAVRADLAERLAWEVSKRRKEAETAAFALPPELASIVSCPGDAFQDVLKGLGLSPAEKDPETGLPTLWRYKRRHRPEGTPAKPAKPGPRGKKAKAPRNKSKKAQPGRSRQPDPSSPFAALAALVEPKPEKPSAHTPPPASKTEPSGS